MTIDISFRKLDSIPEKYFGITTHGSVWCYHNQLTSLTGSPRIVNGIFNCADNKLTSLTGSPRIVKESFYSNNNKLFNLDFLPLYYMIISQ